MKKAIDIFDLLPSDAAKPIDELGYSFLKSRGYDVSGVSKSYKRRSRLKDAMKKRGEELRYCGAVNQETKGILVWFELYKGEERIAVSQGIKFLPKDAKEVTNGDEQNQERPQDLTEADA